MLCAAKSLTADDRLKAKKWRESLCTLVEALTPGPKYGVHLHLHPEMSPKVQYCMTSFEGERAMPRRVAVCDGRTSPGSCLNSRLESRAEGMQGVGRPYGKLPADAKNLGQIPLRITGAGLVPQQPS